jgi:transposase
MKARRKRRQFTVEFKAEAVRLTRVGARSVTQIAKDLDLTESALRQWIQHEEAQAAPPSPDALTASEREELMRLRKEVKRLEMEREILKKATAFFARESR